MVTRRGPFTTLTDLSVTPIAETIRALSDSSRSGDLQVRSGKVVKVAFFDEGRLVFAAGNIKKERLGEALVSLGRISSEEFARASALVKNKKTRFGDALVRAGIMGQDAVGASVTHWVEKTIVSLFALKAGSAFFEERDCPITPDYRVTLSLPQVLHGGIKAMESRDLVLAGLGDLDRKIVVAPVALFDFDRESCTAEEAQVLDLAARGRSIRDLATDGRGLSFVRLRAVYALLASGVLQDATVANLAAAAKRDALRSEVDDDLKCSAELDSGVWLGVPAAAPREDRVQAIERKIQRCHELLATAEGEDLRTDIELVLGRANTMLQLARRSEAPAAPASAPAPPPTAAPAPAPAAPSGTASMGSEHLMMEASLKLSVGDYAGAVDAYARLVELNPDDPALRLRLALAMARSPQYARQAERQFAEVVELAPDSADAHYQFGLYYKSMKVTSRSIPEFRAALRLDPRHKGAQEELDKIGPKESGLASLKKLLQ
jgi:tetratricopeptide (TPR) repeat protein